MNGSRGGLGGVVQDWQAVYAVKSGFGIRLAYRSGRIRWSRRISLGPFFVSARLFRHLCGSLLSVVALVFALAGNSASQEYYAKYDLSPKPGVVNLLVQPMAYPLAFISSAMQRDRILRAELAEQGLELRVFGFKKGNDIVNVATPNAFGMAFLGDMPTVSVIVKFPVAIAGLGKRNFSSVVSRDFSRLEELKGRKIGYSAGSSSHLVLMRGLRASSMTDDDVQLVPMEPANMPDALDSGAIEAFSAWEPTPSIALARSAKSRAIYRGMSTDWVVMPMAWALKQPRAAKVLVAGYVRSINWMRRSRSNLEQVAGWVLSDGASFTGEPSKLALAKAADIAQKDLLDVPGAPSTPSLVDGVPPLSREFAFLKGIGRIPPDRDDSALRAAFQYDGLKTVQTDPRVHRLYTFEYDQ